MREHLVFTPGGRIAFVLQMPGNRHDSQGLYALLRTTFQGHLLGDNAYWPRADKREALARKGITVAATTRKGWKVKNTPEDEALLEQWRGSIERCIGLFDLQFHAPRTLCRSRHHYEARRWTKALSHNLSRNLNRRLRRPPESMMHFRLAA